MRCRNKIGHPAIKSHPTARALCAMEKLLYEVFKSRRKRKARRNLLNLRGDAPSKR